MGNLFRRLANDLVDLLFGFPPGRFLFRLGPFVTSYSVTKTPEFHHYPLRGDVAMAFTLPDDKKVTVTIDAVKDKKGNPAKLDGAPVWATDNTDVIALTPSADGMSCVVSAVGPLTPKVNVQVTGDADLGDGVSPIIGVLEIEVVSGAANTFSLTPGPLEDQ